MSLALELAIRLGSFKSGESGPPFPRDILFYSKKRVGGDVVNDYGSDGELVYNPLTDVIDLEAWGWNGTDTTIDLRTVDGVETFIIITSADELQAINTNATTLSANYIMANDIDLGVPPYNIGAGWTPIGSLANQYSGCFSGNGYKVSNLLINDTGLNNAGLFGVVRDCSVSNICVINANVLGNDTVGVLIGRNFTNINVVNCCTINCVVDGTIRVGGVVGYNTTSNIINCYSNSSVGENSSPTRSGGITGWNSGLDPLKGVSFCFFSGTIGITTRPIVGVSFAYLADCYYDSETTGVPSTTYGTPKITAEMQTQSTFSGWDFKNTWNIKPASYPNLKYEDGEANPIVLSKIVNNYDGYIYMPQDILFEVSPGVYVPAFDRGTSVAPSEIYTDACRGSSYYLGDNTPIGDPKRFMWHISELENHMLTTFVEDDYQQFFFVEVKYIPDTADVLSLAKILIYKRVITDPTELSKVYKFIKYNVINFAETINFSELIIF